MSTLVFLDSWLVIVAKYAGEAVQTRDKRRKTVVTEVRERFSESKIQPVHRIDQPVSGTVVLARTASAFSFLQAAFASGEVDRRYLAVVDHPPEPVDGTLEDFLLVPDGENRAGRRSRIVESGTPGARSARLTYRTLGFTDHHTILLVELDTGRHHQIRAQLAHRGWHVVGDALYGARRPMRDRSIALHAWYVSVPHPFFRERITCSAPLPDSALWRGVTHALNRPLA